MSPSFDIIDVVFDDLVESLYPGWGIYTCEATLADGETIRGTIQGDGLGAFTLDSFEADEA